MEFKIDQLTVMMIILGLVIFYFLLKSLAIVP